jgi:hypothetical protein
MCAILLKFLICDAIRLFYSISQQIRESRNYCGIDGFDSSAEEAIGTSMEIISFRAKCPYILAIISPHSRFLTNAYESAATIIPIAPATKPRVSTEAVVEANVSGPTVDKTRYDEMPAAQAANKL